MKPSVGRIVHYIEGSGQPCLAAIVAKVHETGNLNLAVISEVGGLRQAQGIEEAPVAGPRVGGQWHWPERVEE